MQNKNKKDALKQGYKSKKMHFVFTNTPNSLVSASDSTNSDTGCDLLEISFAYLKCHKGKKFSNECKIFIFVSFLLANNVHCTTKNLF
jgi:hypothetical protein